MVGAPDPTPADRALARSLAANAVSAALAVIDADGLPYAALIAPGLAPDGTPLALVSDLAAHGRALAADGRASLLYAAPIDPANPLTGARLTLQGRAAPARPGDREAYLSRHPEAAVYIDFDDMRLYRFDILAARLVVGFGRAVTLGRISVMGVD